MHADALRDVYKKPATPVELGRERRTLFAATPITFSGRVPNTVSRIYHGKDPRDFGIKTPILLDDGEGATLLSQTDPGSGLRGGTAYLRGRRVVSGQARELFDGAQPDGLDKAVERLTHALQIVYGTVRDVSYAPSGRPDSFRADHILLGIYLIDPETGELLWALRNAPVLNVLMSLDTTGRWTPLEEGPRLDQAQSRKVASAVVDSIHKYAFMSGAR